MSLFTYTTFYVFSPNLKKIFQVVLPIVVELVKISFKTIQNAWNIVLKPVFNAIGAILNTLILPVFKTVFSSVSSVVTITFKGIKTVYNSILKPCFNTISSTINSLRKTFSSVFGSIKSTVTSIFSAIKNAMINPINTAKNTIKTIVNSIKGFFSGFKISWPKIPMPHFTVKPKGWEIGDLLTGTIPKLGIDWYAKAMDTPVALDSATIFGMSNGNLLGGGEKGTEYITGEKGLTRIIDNVFDSYFNEMLEKQMSLLEIIIELLRIIAYKDPTIVLNDNTLVGKLIDKIDIALNQKQIESERGL